MHKQNLWQRWFGTSKQSRKPPPRCVVRGAEPLERREMLSALAAAGTISLLDAPLDPAAILSEGGKAGGKDPGGGAATTARYTYESLKAQLEAWEDQFGTVHGDLVKLARIGGGSQTYDPAAADPSTYNPNDPRDVEGTRGPWAIKISDNASVDEGLAEPDLKYIATMHGTEPLGMEMSMRFIGESLTKYGTDSQITGLVDGNEIWVLPLMNPDGFANNTRTNFNGYDLNRNFPELAPLDPYADVKPGFASLLAGLPTDKNGNCLVPEVKAVMEWSNAHDFVLAANFHTGALLVNYPYDNGVLSKKNYAKSPDDALYIGLANIYASNFNADSPKGTNMTITNGAQWYVITGGMQDFDYRFFDTKHVTVELYAGYGYGTVKRPLNLDQQWGYNRDAMLAYLYDGIRLVLPSSAAAVQQAAQPVGADTTMLQTIACSTDLASNGRSANKRRAGILLHDDVLRDWAAPDALAVSL